MFDRAAGSFGGHDPEVGAGTWTAGSAENLGGVRSSLPDPGMVGRRSGWPEDHESQRTYHVTSWPSVKELLLERLPVKERDQNQRESVQGRGERGSDK